MSAFDQLAPFIQEYIYEHNWHELREIQVAACDVIFNKQDNLLIATPTASGKTEAAFLPVMTQISETRTTSVSVLYIAPLKALINDQFVRLSELLDKADIRLTKWHGDAEQSAKKKLLTDPQGILQITPESLEAMLMKRKQEARKLFGDLQYIIIDEVHTFISSDRGIQLSSLLDRLQQLIGLIPRRIGLSATLGDISKAEEWLNRGTNARCISPTVNVPKRKVNLLLNHFATSGERDQQLQRIVPFYDELYKLTKGQKTIVFSNTRGDVERHMINLKEIAHRQHEPDVFLLHHGSIAAAEREFTEKKMKHAEQHFVVGASLTLELGIDLGDVTRIIQTGCPSSVASLAQRLGRSGRRTGIAEMCFLFEEKMEDSKHKSFYDLVNWEFVRCIALIELYLVGWLETIQIHPLPYNVLVHQTMSFLYSNGETNPSHLAQSLLSQAAFAQIPQADYQVLLRYMLAEELIERTSRRGLLLGLKGEALAKHYDFYSVFEDPVEYAVRQGAYEVGTISNLLARHEKFGLNGRTWLVVEVDKKQKIIYVEQAKGKAFTSWSSDVSHELPLEVVQKMKEVLAGTAQFPYLAPNAQARLTEVRATIAQSGILQAPIVELSSERYCLTFWIGTKAMTALRLSLIQLLPDIVFCSTKDNVPLLIVSNVNRAALEAAIATIGTSQGTAESLVAASDEQLIDNLILHKKYNDCVPRQLLRKQFAHGSLDLVELKRHI